MNRSLKLVRYATIEGKGWRRGQVVKLKNGKLKAGVMILGGVEVACPIGRYQMLRYEQDKAVYTDLGNDASEAWNRYSLEFTKQNVKLAAVDAGLHILTEDDPKAKSLKRYAADFLATHSSLPHRSDDSSRIYRQVTESFLKVTRAVYPKDVTKEDVILWHGWLRKEKGYSDRTASGHYMALRGFLAFCKLVPRELIPPGTYKLLRTYTKRIVDVYTPQTVEALMKASLGNSRSLLWDFAYKTGLRDSELQMVTRFDLHGLDGDDPILHVKERDEYGQIKDAEERGIELHKSLIPGLKAWLREQPTKILLFGTSADKPDTKMLLSLKLTAKRAGLNCGRCKGCLGPNNHCREYTLHRFRRTFTTRLLRATGGDLRSVMARTGHSDISSVMRHLARLNKLERPSRTLSSAIRQKSPHLYRWGLFCLRSCVPHPQPHRDLSWVQTNTPADAKGWDASRFDGFVECLWACCQKAPQCLHCECVSIASIFSIRLIHLLSVFPSHEG